MKVVPFIRPNGVGKKMGKSVDTETLLSESKREAPNFEVNYKLRRLVQFHRWLSALAHISLFCAFPSSPTW